MPSEFDKYLDQLPEKDRQDIDATKDQIQESGSATPQTVESDYQDREGNPLDSNVYGYGDSSTTQPLSNEVKEEAKQTMDEKYPCSPEQEENEAPEQEQQQDIDRWEDDGGR